MPQMASVCRIVPASYHDINYISRPMLSRHRLIWAYLEQEKEKEEFKNYLEKSGVVDALTKGTNYLWVATFVRSFAVCGSHELSPAV